ncbi:Helix-turn-helix domain-containing protein [Tessaracoccus bendigoensis DSM 12906]|uniref:Helix-turn-helix domain-containing protein n=1 Tax=Tessaracoccus bendigoensis DSM 12906 TaxID=1123357 RepID=A0A1M6JLA8_9ACTN|nr:helix-turn-helix transcriptional regulator [Tessaracoccus bendigoensis]SHJ47489.1 Helix-turn-helix domain-containing protein [Tessaracoccus bendigoensis DSM 12906]
MSSLNEIFGIDPDAPEVIRARHLIENDQDLLDSLVRIRKERGLSQGDVAKILGVKQPSVADFEAHDSNPTMARIRRYADAVGALISHKVEMDTGQLLDDRRGQWVSASLEVEVTAPQGAREQRKVIPISAARSWSVTAADPASSSGTWILGA